MIFLYVFLGILLVLAVIGLFAQQRKRWAYCPFCGYPTELPVGTMTLDCEKCARILRKDGEFVAGVEVGQAIIPDYSRRSKKPSGDGDRA